MGNDYNVKFRKLSGYGEDLASQLASWSTALSGIMDKVDVLIATEQASGETADRMRQYFNDAHSNVIICIQTLLQSIEAEWVQYFAGYWKDIDTHVDAKMDTAQITSLKKKMVGFCTESQAIDARVKAILDGIDDIYTPSKKQLVTDESIYETIKENIDSLCEKIDANEQKYLSSVNGNLHSLADAILQTIQGFYSQNAMYKGSYSGAGNNPAYNSMLEKTIGMQGDLENNEAKINEARSGVEKHAQELAKYDYEIEQKRLEEERRKREEQVKWVKFGVAVLGVAVTAAVTVGTGGVGTFFVAGTIISSGVMGAVEGGVNEWGEQYIENGWEGMDWSRIGRGALIGGGKGLVTGAISAGSGAMFDKIGKAGFIAKAGDSTSFLVKHGSKLGMKVLEGGTEEVIKGVGTRFIDNSFEAWIDDSSQKVDFGKGAKEAFDIKQIGKDFAVGSVESGTSYVVDTAGKGVFGLDSEAKKTKITKDTVITRMMEGKYVTVEVATEIASGMSKRSTETYIDSRIEGKSHKEALKAAGDSAFDAREIGEDIISGVGKGATKPMVEKNKAQKEYEKELEKNIREKGTANTDDEIKQLNEMREKGELDIEDDPNEKVRKNVNSGNYAHERKQLDEMRANGELDDDYESSGSKRVKAETPSADAETESDTAAKTASTATVQAESAADAGETKAASESAASKPAGKDDTAAPKAGKKIPTMANAYEMADDPDLFKDNQAGDISYGETEDGKVAYGSLKYNDDPERNQYAQRTAGGDERRPDDHGGHLIAASEGGDPGKDNLVAMNDDLNTGRYKDQEMKEIDALKDGVKVYKYVETYGSGGTERPDTIMGYTITETPDGKRDVEYFHTPNESSETLEEWDRIASSVPDYVPEGMTEAEYHGMSEAEYAEMQKILDEVDGY